LCGTHFVEEIGVAFRGAQMLQCDEPCVSVRERSEEGLRNVGTNLFIIIIDSSINHKEEQIVTTINR
jgi:hypothetical protein